jgi:iron(III) transport system ATP-binding protein
MARIAISSLNKAFDGNHVLKDLNLNVGEREFVTLLGPSGCGKTTTLRLLAGFLTPDSGEVRVDDRLLSSSRSTVPPERRKMGMVFQNYAVWPHMNVYENVAFGLKLAKLSKTEIRTRIARILAAVGLEGLEDRHPGQLSGGQQQRVALARSLVAEPSILLLDEPLSNLDAKLRERMRTELKDLQRRTGITFVYVTHDQAEAMALSDRIAVFHQGVLQQYGCPRDVYERPANLFVADFMGLVNKVSGSLIEHAGGVARVRIGPEQTLAASLPAGGDVGSREVLIAIRPEAIGLSVSPTPPGENILDGVVVDSTFLGNIVDYEVDVGGQLFRVQADRHTRFDAGSKVYLAIAVGECVVMREEPTAATGGTKPS